MAESIGKAYKPWLILSLAVLVGSLMLLAVAGAIAFLGVGSGPTPLWVIILGAASAFGLGLGFAGYFLIMVVAGFQAWKSSRKVQIIPPDHSPQ